jgi:hypothetical protein
MLPVPRHERRQQWLEPPATLGSVDAARRHGQHPPPAASRRNPQLPSQTAPGPRPGFAGQERSQPPPSAVGTHAPGAPYGTTSPNARPRSP